MKKTMYTNKTTTKAIMVTSKEAIHHIKNNLLGKVHLPAIQRVFSYSDVTILGDNVVLFNDNNLANDVAYEIQHDGIENGGWATVYKVSIDVCYEQLSNEQIQKSLHGQ